MWVEAISAWLLALRAAGRPTSTLRLREYQLRRVAAALAPAGPFEITGGQLVAWVGAQDWSAETRRSWRSALRGFYGWAHGAGLIETDPALALPAVKPTEPRPRPTPEEAYRVALARADDRVRVMLRLAAELGLRRGEVAQVHSGDLGRDLFGWSLTVHGKGGKPRLVPVPDGLAAVLRARGRGFLFPGNDHGHLSAHYVGKLVARVLPGARFGTIAYAHERDVFVVQDLLGHASPVTTRRYVQVPADNLRRTVAAVAAV